MPRHVSNIPPRPPPQKKKNIEPCRAGRWELKQSIYTVWLSVMDLFGTGLFGLCLSALYKSIWLAHSKSTSSGFRLSLCLPLAVQGSNWSVPLECYLPWHYGSNSNQGIHIVHANLTQPNTSLKSLPVVHHRFQSIAAFMIGTLVLQYTNIANSYSAKIWQTNTKSQNI